MSTPIQINATAFSNADSLGYLGQHAVAAAAGGEISYRIIGGHMVRLLLLVYPTPAAVSRSTIDADAAVDDLAVIGPIVEELMAQNFHQEKGNVFTKVVRNDQLIEVNILASRRGDSSGIQPMAVPGVGQVDTLPELAFVLTCDPLFLDVTATLIDRQVIYYQTKIPDLEAAVVLKAHSWRARGVQTDRDLADLHSLLEIREAYPSTHWKLNDSELRGARKDTALHLHSLAEALTKKTSRMPVPDYIDRLRMAGLISKHVTRPRLK